MNTRKIQRFCLGAAALAMSCATAQAAATIMVAVTPVAGSAVSDLVADFLSVFPKAGYSVSIVVSSDEEVRQGIIAGGARGPYDLFLSQSSLAPADLKRRNPALVSGNPFPYARDTLVLYSLSVDVRAGVPAQLQTFSLPDPVTSDPYGLAATQRLGPVYPFVQRLTVKTPDATSSFATVEYLGTPYGFTGKSQICTAVTGAEVFREGSFHHEFPASNDIVLTGVKIARTRTADEEKALTDFVDFLRGPGVNSLRQYCFKSPNA